MHASTGHTVAVNIEEAGINLVSGWIPGFADSEFDTLLGYRMAEYIFIQSGLLWITNVSFNCRLSRPRAFP